MSGGAGLLEACGERLNPMVVKELRQMVRGRFISASLIFFLVVLLAVLSVFMANSSSSNFSQGPAVFIGFLSTLVFVTLFFVPFSVAAKIGRERDDEDSDLLYITNLSAEKILFGKLTSGIVTTALFFLVAMPFMSLTYFLRGIDFPTMLLIIAAAYLIIVAMIQLFIFLACLAPNRGTRTILALFGLTGTILVYSIMTSILGGALLGAMHSSFKWVNIGWFLACDLFFIGSFFMLSAAALKPPAFNRAAPVRAWFSLWWLLVLGVGGWLSGFEKEFVFGWSIFGSILGMLGFLISICEREELSPRIRRTIPSSGFKRFSAFFLWSGAAGGMAWSVLIMIVSLTVLSLIYQPLIHDNIRDSFIALAVYSCAYALSAHLLYHRFFHRRIRKGYCWVILLGLLLLGTLLPWIISFLVLGKPSMDVDELPFLFFPNPFTIIMSGFTRHIFGWVFFWLIMVVALEVRWFLKQVRAFQPLAEPDASPEENHA